MKIVFVPSAKPTTSYDLYGIHLGSNVSSSITLRSTHSPMPLVTSCCDHIWMPLVIGSWMLWTGASLRSIYIYLYLYILIEKKLSSKYSICDTIDPPGRSSAWKTDGDTIEALRYVTSLLHTTSSAHRVTVS
jgi:hypothetical protein